MRTNIKNGNVTDNSTPNKLHRVDIVAVTATGPITVPYTTIRAHSLP